MFVIKKDDHLIDFDRSKIVAAILATSEAIVYERQTEVERENYRNYVRVMAELEWPAYFEYDPVFYEEILRHLEELNQDGIEQAIYNHFGAVYLKDLLGRLGQSRVIAQHRMPALKEALRLYRSRYYYGASSILVTQMLGIISDIDTYVGRNRGFSEKNLDLISSRYHVSRANEKGRVIKALLEAKDLDNEAGEFDYMIGYMRMKFFRDGIDEEDLDKHANRHSICHGEQCNYGTKEHTLKLILCLDALEYVAELLSDEQINHCAG